MNLCRSTYWSFVSKFFKVFWRKRFKRTIYLDSPFKLSYKLSMKFWNENEEVLSVLPEFNRRFKWRFLRKTSQLLLILLVSVEPKINRGFLFFFFTGSIPLRFLFFSHSNSVIVWIRRFGDEFVLELQWFWFDDEDSSLNLWELHEFASIWFNLWFWKS